MGPGVSAQAPVDGPPDVSNKSRLGDRIRETSRLIAGTHYPIT